MPALGPFLDAVAGRLDAMTNEQIKLAVLSYASELRPAAREPFLTMLGRKVPPPAAAPLLQDIENLLARVRAGEFYDGWGWDDSIHAERAFGDDSWAAEMDSLFDGSAAAFLAGDMDLTRQAYGHLLHAIWGGEEAEQLSGAEDPTELLGSDLAEAMARYLRALYETTPPQDRAGALLNELHAFAWTGRRVSLTDIREARPQDLAGLSEFLPAWIKRLEADSTQGFEGEARRLLSEAVIAKDGPEGLAGLARERGVRQPELYLDLVRELQRQGRGDESAAAAREALAAPVPPWGSARPDRGPPGGPGRGTIDSI